MKEMLIARIEEMRKDIENSAAVHNALVGRKQEAEAILLMMAEKEEEEAKALLGITETADVLAAEDIQE